MSGVCHERRQTIKAAPDRFEDFPQGSTEKQGGSIPSMGSLGALSSKSSPRWLFDLKLLKGLNAKMINRPVAA